MNEVEEKQHIVAFEASDDAADPAELAWAFPDVNPGMRPYGGRVIVQLRRIKKKTAGKIILVEETKENEKWNNMIGKIVAIGPLAFKIGRAHV